MGAAAAAGIAPPLLVREVTSHKGETLLRIDDEASASRLHQLAFDGRSFYVCEYHEFRSDDGFYRKYRVFVVDGVPYLRHVVMSREWNVHASQRSLMADFPQLMREELFELQHFATELRPLVEPIAAAAHRALKLDYFGIDCHLSRDGDALLFEANPNMDCYTHRRAEVRPYVDAVFDALAALIRRRLGDAGSG
jgi:hypothetical protein